MFQAAAYQPFFRAHAHLDTRRREPWLLDADYTNAIREAIRDRYALLPYWYTLFYHGERQGGPIMRPLWVEFPKDKLGFAVENEHLVGSGLLVHPVTSAGASHVSVYFPGENEVWQQNHIPKSSGSPKLTDNCCCVCYCRFGMMSRNSSTIPARALIILL